MEDLEAMGGSEGDIRSLYFWSRAAFYVLMGSVVLWAALGVFNLYQGISWAELDSMTGSTQAESDIAWGITYLAAAVLSYLLATWMRRDVLDVFSDRRFKVPREKLLVYGMLGLPFGFVAAGALLMLVNYKLSHPDFLPSHAEAYPDAMPGWTRAVPAAEAARAAAEVEVPPIPEAVPGAAAGPPEGFVAMPTGGAEPETPEQMGAPATAAAPVPAMVEEYEPVPAGAAPQEAAAAPPPAEAFVEEVPAVVAQVAPAEAYVEEVPAVVGQEAPVEAVVEEVPAEVEDFEEVAEEAEEEQAAPTDAKAAHDQLMDRLLGK